MDGRSGTNWSFAGSVETVVTTPSWSGRLAILLSAGSIVRFDEPMARRTTLRVGGPADCYVEPADERDLAVLIRFCAEQTVPWMVIGRGSNVLVRDGGIRGVVIGLNRPHFQSIRVEENRISAGAGAKLKAVAVEARRHALSGLEFMEGIPGSVGGSLRMNAGAMGSSLFDVARTVRVMDASGDAQELAASEMGAGYRRCLWLKNRIALGAVFAGRPAPVEEVAERMNAYSRKRWDSQPAAPSAGCMFKNPAAIPAGRLIDELGLKGCRVGGAMVSDVHGNFMVNDRQATARDVLRLMDKIRAEAKSRRGIDLEPEVQIVGEDPDASKDSDKG